MTRCVGHRGAAGLAPENTLASYRAGIAAGADAVECDVHLSADGRPVLIHDADLGRTTDGSGLVGDLPLAALRELDAAACFPGGYARQRIPTLDEYLELLAGRCRAQIEVKVPERGAYAGIERLVAATLREHQALDSAQVICFDPATLRRLHALEPALELGYLGSARSLPPAEAKDPARLAAAAREVGASFLGLDRRFFRPEHLAAARKAGLGMAVWTVNEPAEMERLVALGLDAITSDRPDLLRAVLDKG